LDPSEQHENDRAVEPHASDPAQAGTGAPASPGHAIVAAARALAQAPVKNGGVVSWMFTTCVAVVASLPHESVAFQPR
jgi:hypothetical protein